MVLFANCKINIGLDVLGRRADGYHNIDTLVFPVAGLCDAVELLEARRNELTVVGMPLDCAPEKNLCMRALRLMQQKYGAGGAHVYLHKTVPSGAGFGGGSSNAAAVIRSANELFRLRLDTSEMENAAAEIGSDVPFFISNQPAMASGRGEILNAADSAIIKKLSGKYLFLIKPEWSVSTAEAYAGIRPFVPQTPLFERLTADITTWRYTIENAFESHIFELHPRLRQLKESLYTMGAVYASMSGSGSALFGIFDSQPRINLPDTGLFTYGQHIF